MNMRMMARLVLVLLLLGVALHRAGMVNGPAPRPLADAQGPVSLPVSPVAQPLPPASFVQRTVMGLRGKPGHVSEYQPSAAITAAASWHRNGPMRIWYELAPADTPPRAMVVLLHGSGRNGLSLLDMWESTARRAGLLLVAPDAAGQQWERSTAEAEAILRAAADAAARHGIPPDRQFLFGHSDGAAMAQWLLAQDGRPWRAAAVHGGFAAPEDLSGQGAGRPFRIYLGARDHLASPVAARASGAAMAARGHPSDLLLIEEHTHWFYTLGPQIAWHGWMWFETQLNPAPAG